MTVRGEALGVAAGAAARVQHPSLLETRPAESVVDRLNPRFDRSVIRASYASA
ncbi:hypothetical protein [Nocardioides ungokensis]